MTPNRRQQRAARALLAHADAALTQAATQLFHGQPLQALRAARLVEQLIALDAALDSRRTEDALREGALRERKRALDDRAYALDRRAAQLDEDARAIRTFCESMGLNHDVLTGR